MKTSHRRLHLSLTDTHLDFAREKSQLKILTGQLTPTASLNGIIQRTANQQRINIGKPVLNGAATSIGHGRKNDVKVRPLNKGNHVSITKRVGK